MLIRNLISLSFCYLSIYSLFSQFDYSGPIPKITEGYGSQGIYTPKTINFSVQPDWDNFFTDERTLASITYPDGLSGQAPIIFYIPWDYDSRLSVNKYNSINFERANRLASQGYCYVTLQYNNPGELNDSDPLGLCKATLKHLVDSFSQYIDTTRVGIVGSFLGAGSRSIQVASEYFIHRNWGSNGRFLLTDHPGPAVPNIWEDMGNPVFSNEALESFPDDMKYISIVGDITHWNDPSYAIDFYQHIGVPDSNKNFMEINSDTLDGYIYYASEVMIMTNTQYVNDTWAKYVKYDAYDEYVYYRTIDALGHLLWKNDYNARQYCLGGDENGNIPIADGKLKPIHGTDEPDPDRYWYAKARGAYVYPCWGVENLRKKYVPWPCHGLMEKESIDDDIFKIFPNPVSKNKSLKFDSKWLPKINSIDVFDLIGRRLMRLHEPTVNCILTDDFPLGSSVLVRINMNNSAKSLQRIILIE